MMRTTALLVTLLAAAGTLTAEPQGPDAKKAPVPQADRVPINRDYYFQGEYVRNRDGTITWFYLTNHVGSTYLKSNIDQLKLKGVKTETRERDTFNFIWDPRLRAYNKGFTPKREKIVDENLLMITFPSAYKDIIEEFLERFDVAEPQVYIHAKIVEIDLDRSIEYGVSWFFDKSGATSSNPNTFFQEARSSFRSPSFTAPFLSPLNTGLAIGFNDISMGMGTLTAQIEALQERGTANILSEPGIVATQGKRATLVTGEETPVFELTLSGTTETVTTRFKETGIRLDLTPLHIGREFVKLRVRPEVSTITGFVTTSGEITFQSPIIAQRNAETVVSVRDGMTLVIGGLYANAEISNKSGIPILGDIPVLGFLFSRTSKTKTKTELLFLITPHILRSRFGSSVFVPEREKRRLAARERAEAEKKK